MTHIVLQFVSGSNPHSTSFQRRYPIETVQTSHRFRPSPPFYGLLWHIAPQNEFQDEKRPDEPASNWRFDGHTWKMEGFGQKTRESKAVWRWEDGNGHQTDVLMACGTGMEGFGQRFREFMARGRQDGTGGHQTGVMMAWRTGMEGVGQKKQESMARGRRDGRDGHQTGVSMAR